MMGLKSEEANESQMLWNKKYGLRPSTPTQGQVLQKASTKENAQ